MSEQRQYYLEIIRTQGDIRRQLEFLSSMTACLFKIANNFYDKKLKIKNHQQVLESKSYRIATANHSIISIANGHNISLLKRNLCLIDVDSLFSITRMQIETFIILFYIVFDDTEDHEKDFRFNVYKLHGIQKQQGFGIPKDYSENQIQYNKLEIEEKESIEAIKNSIYFKAANVKMQKEYLKPRKAKLVDTKLLFEKSGFRKSRLDMMWSIYSNYAHSEYISDHQYFYRTNNPEFITENISLVVEINKIITAKLILLIKNLDPENIKLYNSFPDRDKIHIDMWAKL